MSERTLSDCDYHIARGREEVFAIALRTLLRRRTSAQLVAAAQWQAAQSRRLVVESVLVRRGVLTRRVRRRRPRKSVRPASLRLVRPRPRAGVP